MSIEASYSFVDTITEFKPSSAWSPDIVPGGFRYTCVDGPGTLIIKRTPPAADVVVNANTGDSVTQVGSVAVVERVP